MASPVGGAKQMLAELESQDKKIAERKRPRSKESIEEERASKELDRGTLMSGSLVAPTIAREGDLTVRRFAGGGSADKGKLTLEPVGGVEFGPANPAPRLLKDYVPGAADLPRSPPQKAPGWGDPAAYNLQGLSYGLGTGLTNALEGLSSLPGTAMDLMRGFGQRVRELSPEHLRGSAPAADTTVYDAAQAALKRAAGNPVEAAKQVAGAAMDYVRQGVSSPQNMAQFIGENINPLPKVGPRAGPTMGIVKEKGGNWVSVPPERLAQYGEDLETIRDDRDAQDLIEQDNPGPVDWGMMVEGLQAKNKLYGAALESPDFAIYELAQRNPLLTDWVTKKLGRYVKSEMGTKEDPIRALAEQEISHLSPEVLFDTSYQAMDPWDGVLEGPHMYGIDAAPRTVLGQSEMARNWEEISDYAIRKDTYQNTATSKVRRPRRSDLIIPPDPSTIEPGDTSRYGAATRPATYFNKPRPYEIWAAEDEVPTDTWIKDALRDIGGDFAVNNPNAQVYSFRTPNESFSYLGFDHLVDELSSALSDSSMPQQLRLDPKDLNTLSVSDAVRRVHDINVWRENQSKKPSLELANNPATVRVLEYPLPGDDSKLGSGYRWDSLELNKSMPRREAQQALQEALSYEGRLMGGCQGSYCNSVMDRGTKILSLRNAATGEPHVTVEIQSGGVLGQIKGKGNAVPKEQYRPMVLQFLNSQAQSISPQHNWGMGDDLRSMQIIDLLEQRRGQRTDWKPFFGSLSNIQSSLEDLPVGKKGGTSIRDDLRERYRQLRPDLNTFLPEGPGGPARYILPTDAANAVSMDLARRVSGGQALPSKVYGRSTRKLVPLIDRPLPRFLTSEQLRQEAIETLDAYVALELAPPPAKRGK